MGEQVGPRSKKAAAIMLCAVLGTSMITGVSVSAKDKDCLLYTSSLHTDENRRYAGDQCTLYHNAGSDPSGTGSISDRRKTREGEYKR